MQGDGTADITAVDSSSINIGSFLTRGFDLEADYTLPMVGKGTMNIRVIASNLYDMIIDTGLGNPPFNYAGQSGPVASFGGFNTSPDWAATAFATYTRGKFRNTLELHYIGSGTLNATYFDSPIGSATNTTLNSVSDNSVSIGVLPELVGLVRFAQGLEQPRPRGVLGNQQPARQGSAGRAGRQLLPDEPGVLRYDWRPNSGGSAPELLRRSRIAVDGVVTVTYAGGSRASRCRHHRRSRRARRRLSQWDGAAARGRQALLSYQLQLNPNPGPAAVRRSTSRVLSKSTLR